MELSTAQKTVVEHAILGESVMVVGEAHTGVRTTAIAVLRQLQLVRPKRHTVFLCPTRHHVAAMAEMGIHATTIETFFGCRQRFWSSVCTTAARKAMKFFLLGGN